MRKVVLVTTALAMALSCGCSSKESSKKKKKSNDSTEELSVSGQINVGNLNLTSLSKPTHVAAINMSGEMTVAEIASDGKFSVGMETDSVYVLVYLDDSKTGTDMIQGLFKSGGLDSLPASGEADAVSLGKITLAAAASAGELPTSSSTSSLASIADGLGITAATATSFGVIDDIALSRANPDVNGNGQLDVEEDGGNFYLDFHNRFYAKTSSDGQVTMNDIKDQFMPNDTVFSYTGAGIFFWGSTDYFGSSYPDTITYTFEEELNSTAAGQPLTATHPSFASNQPTWSLETQNSAPPPAGKYIVNIGSETFTFPSLPTTDMQNDPGLVHFFLKINTSGATVTGISYKWMKRGTGGVWSEATLEEVNAIVKEGTPNVSFRIGDEGSSQTIGWSIPTTALSGTLSVSQAQETTTAPAFSDLQNPGISYDNKLGQRFFWAVY